MEFKLEDLTILCDIQEKLRGITRDQIDFVAARLGKPGVGEKLVGGPLNELCQTLFTLTYVLRSEVGIERAMSLQLADQIIVEDHQQRAVIADSLEDVVLELLWAQARTDSGYWQPTGVGIREGWMLMSHEHDKGPDLRGLLAVLKGGISPEG